MMGMRFKEWGALARQAREKKLLAEVGEAADELCVCHGKPVTRVSNV